MFCGFLSAVKPCAKCADHTQVGIVDRGTRVLLIRSNQMTRTTRVDLVYVSSESLVTGTQLWIQQEREYRRFPSALNNHPIRNRLVVCRVVDVDSLKDGSGE